MSGCDIPYRYGGVLGEGPLETEVVRSRIRLPPRKSFLGPEMRPFENRHEPWQILGRKLYTESNQWVLGHFPSTSKNFSTM